MHILYTNICIYKMEILCYSETFSLSIVVQQSIIYWMLELKERKIMEYVCLALFTYQREQNSTYKRTIFNFTCSIKGIMWTFRKVKSFFFRDRLSI